MRREHRYCTPRRVYPGLGAGAGAWAGVAIGAATVLSPLTTIARADVAFAQHFSQVSWSGLIGAFADALQWNELDSHGAVAPDALFDGGIRHELTYYNEADPPVTTSWWGRSEVAVWSQATYVRAGVTGFAAGIEAGAAVANTTSGPPTIMTSHATSQYRVQVNVTAPSSFHLTGRGNYVGVFNSMKFSRVSDGAIAYWSLFAPDGERTIDATGTLEPGEWKLEIFHDVSSGDPVSVGLDTRVVLIVGDIVGGACNLADITEIGGTTDAPGSPDGQLTVDDLIYFVNLFSDGTGCPGFGGIRCNRADVTGIGGPPAGPDSQLTVDDLIAFVNAFGDGC